jgi:hypothetical protein
LSSVKYIFIHTETHTSYFTWLTPGSFEENKEAINSALDIVLNIKHIPGFQTISFIQPHEHRDLSQAQNKITQLNNILRIVCDGQIELGYLHEMNADELYTFSDLDEIIFRNNILLCFNIGNACVSSITMLEKPFKNRIEMESFTHPHCQGQQFNKLLRAVSIMLLPMIYPNATVYRSVAVNYLSAYQMIKYFGGMVAYDDDDINFELADYLGDIPLSQATLSQVKMFFDTVTNADVTVDMQINSKNVGNAEDVFDSVVANVDKLMCSL